MSAHAICGEFLYEGTLNEPTHYCVEEYGTEHDHEDAARKPLPSDGQVVNVVVEILGGQIVNHYKRDWVER
jgi:hypothetical protein